MATDVRPSNWPVGSGYSHGFSAEGRAIFLAGQIGWDPVTLAIAPGGMPAQVRQSLANIVTVLEAAGAHAGTSSGSPGSSPIARRTSKTARQSAPRTARSSAATFHQCQ